MDVDAALSEVPVNIMPLIDDTDFKTRKTSVAYNAAGMDLVWNFVTTAGAMTQTAVTPTTSGDYDWVDQGDGMYSIEIPGSSGASINNDTEGFGWFTGFATGVLPWRGPVIGFRAAGLNNALIDSAYSTTRGLAGTALPDAAAAANGGLPTVDGNNRVVGIQGTLTTLDALDTAQDTQHGTTQSAVSTVDGKADTIVTAVGTTIPGLIGTPTDLGGGATLGANNADMAGATFATSTDSQEAIRNRGDAAWVTATGFATPTNVTDAVAAIEAYGDSNWATATGFSTHSADDVWSVATRVLTAGTNIQLPSNGLANVTAWTVAITGNVTGNLSGSIGSLGATAKTDVSTAVLTTQMTEAYAANGVAPTLAEAQFAMHQILMQFGIAGTSLTVKKLDDSTTAFVVTLDDATTPTAAART